jgi:hypothetical protein
MGMINLPLVAIEPYDVYHSHHRGIDPRQTPVDLIYVATLIPTRPSDTRCFEKELGKILRPVSPVYSSVL